MLGGSSQLSTMVPELCSTILFDYRVLGSSRKLGETAEQLMTVAKNPFVGRALNCRFRMLLRGAVNRFSV